MSSTAQLSETASSARRDWQHEEKPSGLKALIFDLDGTLYDQHALRRAMAGRLLCAYALKPAAGRRVLKALQAYRHAQEALRDTGRPHPDAQDAQLQLASAMAGLDARFVSACVDRWMEREPLRILRRYVRSDLMPLLLLAKEQGLQLAVLSDYPAAAKLSAMGIASFFDVVACAQDTCIGCFKPAPAGLQSVIARLKVDRSQCLYIGDRPEIDGEVALRAGVKCLLVAGKKRDRAKFDCIPLSSFSELTKLLQTASHI